ncbi:hypothetical protein LZ30DRAFT_788798 [Colletotrichum cereale]|nr:hypothetical protein LZ30DRAFT_788798 [Colletotrichum cereale]
MGSKNNFTKEPSVTSQSPTATSASCPQTPNGNHHVKSFELRKEHEDTLQDGYGNSETNNNTENDNAANTSHAKLESLEDRLCKRMCTDRKNRLMEIYSSRMGSKIQHRRSREARMVAKRRRPSRDEKRKMD